MHWFALVLVGLVIVTGACGGAAGGDGASGEGTGDEGASGEGNVTEDPLRDALETNLAPALIRDLPGLEGEEASCLRDAVLTELPDFKTALKDIESFAAGVLDGTRAAQERCLTPERIAELEVHGTDVVTRVASEETFLLVIRGETGGLDAKDQEMLDAGYLLCGFAEEAGSLDVLLERLAATPAASAKVAANLMPLLGRVLQQEELISFSTAAVVALCPEAGDIFPQ